MVLPDLNATFHLSPTYLYHSANLQPAAYVANTKFLSVFSWEAA